MPENTTTTEPETPVTTEAQKPSDSVDKPLGENGEKALKAERERASAAEKSAASLQKQLDEIAAANLSDLERAQKEAADYKAQAETAAASALRFRIAAEHGITENTDLILTGSDEETLTAQAKLWAERAPATSSTPKPDLTQGGKPPTGSSPESDFASFISGQLS